MLWYNKDGNHFGNEENPNDKDNGINDKRHRRHGAFLFGKNKGCA